MKTVSPKLRIHRMGISPVIATVVLIAVAVTIAVALSGWAFGLSKSYMRGYGVTILPSESSCSLTSGCVIVLSNQGDTQVSVVSVWVNTQEVSTYTVTPTVTATQYALPPHSQATVDFSLSEISGLSPQQNIEIHIGLSNGNTVSTELVLQS